MSKVEVAVMINDRWAWMNADGKCPVFSMDGLEEILATYEQAEQMGLRNPITDALTTGWMIKVEAGHADVEAIRRQLLKFVDELVTKESRMYFHGGVDESDKDAADSRIQYLYSVYGRLSIGCCPTDCSDWPEGNRFIEFEI